MSENYFNLLKKYLKNCTTSAEYKVIQEMDTIYSNIFMLCEQKKFGLAKKELMIADQEYYSLIKGTKIENHVNIIKIPIVAYLYFKLDIFNNAQSFLELAIDASLNLEEQNPSFLLKMYRIQQYYNSSRISFKKEEYNKWIYQVNITLTQLIDNTTTLNDDESIVYISMIDQIIYETINYSDILKDENHLQKGLNNLNFKNELFKTNNHLKKIKEWFSIKHKAYDNVLDIKNEHIIIESIIFDSKIRTLYKKSLIKSIAPYLNDKLYIKYLGVLKNEKLAS